MTAPIDKGRRHTRSGTYLDLSTLAAHVFIIMAEIDAVNAIDYAVEESRLLDTGGRILYTRVAVEYGIVATTLRRRYLTQCRPVQLKSMNQQRLTPEQGLMLLQWMENKAHAGKPPASYLIAKKTSSLAGDKVGNGWVYRFLKRHEYSLMCKYRGVLGRARHRVEYQHRQEKLIQGRAALEEARKRSMEAVQDKQRQTMMRKIAAAAKRKQELEAKLARARARAIASKSKATASALAPPSPPAPPTTTRSGTSIKAPARF